MKMLMRFIQLSRPGYWFYLFGPFLVGVAAGYNKLDFRLIEIPTLLVAGLFFLLPANLFLHGLTDFFEQRTSRLKPKKELHADASQHRDFLLSLLLIITPFVAVMLYMFINSENWVVVWALLGFLVLGMLDSALPVRAKLLPIFDSVFNVLYVLPGIVGYGILTGIWPSLQVIVSATAWCVAMHAFSAINTLKSDKKLQKRTIATELGKNKTIIFSTTLYILSAILIYPQVKFFAIIAGFSYAILAIAIYIAQSKDGVSAVYGLFPYINVLLGVSLLFTALIG